MTYLVTQYRRKMGEWFFDITDHDAEEISVGTTVICAIGTFICLPGGAALWLV